jgi:rhamnulose-1-phosphate aldolase
MHHSFDEIVTQLGDVGRRMVALQAAEGAAGNVSVFLRALHDVPPAWTRQTVFTLPEPAPALVGGWLVVSASGSRMHEWSDHPEATLCLLNITDDTSATLYAARPLRPTSELNSHLLIHAAWRGSHRTEAHAVLHTQPPYLTFLSHVLPPDAHEFSKRLVRWQPETIMVLPEGIGVLPFETPGSHEQALATASAMRDYRAVVWARHGIIVRDGDVEVAADLIEYAEAAARYEYLNLQLGEPSSGLSDEELRRICAARGIEQHLFE